MSRSQLPLNALRAFEAAARHASFTHAAEELHVTQAAVSHQVKALEERLGVALFVRRPRGLEITSEGEALLPDLGRAIPNPSRVSPSASPMSGGGGGGEGAGGPGGPPQLFREDLASGRLF